MKHKILFIFLILFCLAGCQNNKDLIQELNFNASSSVKLYDYHRISISSNELQISQRDLDAVISMELATKAEPQTAEGRTTVLKEDIAVLSIKLDSLNKTKRLTDYYYKIGSNYFGKEFDKRLMSQVTNQCFTFFMIVPDSYPDETFKGENVQWEVTIEKILIPQTILTEKLAKDLYHVQTVKEAKEKIKNSIIQGRIFDLAYQRILNESTIQKMPPFYETFLNEALLSSKEDSKNDVKKEVHAFFSEYMILKAITENEGLQYTSQKWEQTIEKLASETGLTENEILEQYGSIGICFEMMYNDVKSILPLYVEIQ